MLMSFEEAKASIEYYKLAHPNYYKDIGGAKITDEKIKEALEIVGAVIGGMQMSEDELFKRELTRICNAS